MIKENSDITPIIGFGFCNNGDKKIVDFLRKINKIPFEKSKDWETEIWEFFSKNTFPIWLSTDLLYDKDINIHQYVQEIYSELEYNIKNEFFKFLKDNTILLDSNKLYESLIKIHESIQNGVKIEDYIKFFFMNNIIIRKMFIKQIDERDKRFNEYSTSLQSIDYLISKERPRRIWFLIPDNSTQYPLKEYGKDINEYLKNQYKRQLKKSKKVKKRNPIDSRLRHECFKRDNYKCVECGKTNEVTILHSDHIIPVSQGGADELDNLQTLCEDCNLSKSNKCWKYKNLK